MIKPRFPVNKYVIIPFIILIFGAILYFIFKKSPEIPERALFVSVMRMLHQGI